MCRGLLSLDIIVCVYAIVQVVLSVVQVSSSGTLVSSPTTGGNMITFVLDLVLSYTLVAAAAAAADSQALLNDADYCDTVSGSVRRHRRPSPCRSWPGYCWPS